MHHAKSCFYLPYGGADGTRTHDLCVANRTTGKTLSICLFESCSHQEISRVFPFFPIPYHRVYVASCFFGHVLATWNWGEPPSVETTLLEVKINSHTCDHCRSLRHNCTYA